MNNYSLVLFDFDGTFADTAGDMGNALNLLLKAKGKPPIPIEQLRPHVSDGTPALLRLGFGCKPGEKMFDVLRNQFLETYETNLCKCTELYPGIDKILKRCQATNVPWGIVTNKPENLTRQLMKHLGCYDDAICIIGGDSLPQRKPHPMPIVHACSIAGAGVRSTIFIGDSIRDILAGNDAGTDTLGVTYGYIPPGDDPTAWNANYLVDSVGEIPDILWG